MNGVWYGRYEQEDGGERRGRGRRREAVIVHVRKTVVGLVKSVVGLRGHIFHLSTCLQVATLIEDTRRLSLSRSLSPPRSFQLSFYCLKLIHFPLFMVPLPVTVTNIVQCSTRLCISISVFLSTYR